MKKQIYVFNVKTQKKHKKDIVPFTLSLLGDFTDTVNSLPFRFYDDPIVEKIFPEAGPQNGGTRVEVFGKNFLNYDQNLRCSFGSREVKATYVSDKKLICYTPPSDVVSKRMPFAVSFNFQQKSKEDINFVYYETPQIFSLEPGRGPDEGGTIVRLFGQNFAPFVELPDFGERNKIICKWDGSDEGFGIALSSTFVQCTVPPSKGRIKTIPEICLNRQDYHRNPEVAFYYYHPPTISSIFPKSISPNGGTEVTVTGALCKEGDNIKCQFGDVISKGTFVSDSQIKCISPKIEKPGKIPFKLSCKDGENSASTLLDCFDIPLVESIEPKTGPEHGHTLLKVKGKRFPANTTDVIECAYTKNRQNSREKEITEAVTEATVIDDSTLYCPTPSVLNKEGKNEGDIKEYDLSVTMDGGKILYGKKQKFEYYKQHTIESIQPNIGPVEGGTVVKISGSDFSDLKNNKIVVRFATYTAEIVKIEKNVITVKSPTANYTGPVHVQISFNDQQFDEKNHNKKNVFTYHKWPIVESIEPQRGPVNAENEITLHGMNFIKAYDTRREIIKDFKKEDIDTVYYRFVENNKVLPEIFEKKPENNQIFVMITPKYNSPKNIVYELSYNKMDWKRYNNEYSIEQFPSIKSISPKFANFDEAGKIELNINLVEDYICNNENCKKFKCKYQSGQNEWIKDGAYVNPKLIRCSTPKTRSPEEYVVEISPIDQDLYTNNDKTFAYYSPYIIRVDPQMISSKGNTLIDIYGIGFANTTNDLKAQFGSSQKGNEIKLTCANGPCIQPAEYVDSTHLRTKSMPRNRIKVEATGEPLQGQKFPVEISVFNNDFSNNNIKIFYFDEPEIIQDLDTDIVDDSVFNEEEKTALKPSLIKSIPANTETFIPIPINPAVMKDNYEDMKKFFNFTCKYTMIDTGIEKIESGILASYPKDSGRNNLFFCETPNWEEVGKSKIQISLNGYDFSAESYSFEFTDPLYIHQMKPSCGPIEGNTEVEFIGTGFRNEDDFYFKWGPQNIVPMREQFLFEDANEDEKASLLLTDSKWPVKKMRVFSPKALHPQTTTGGPDYISIDKQNLMPYNELLTNYNLNSYKNQRLEYYYYPQILLQTFTPQMADSFEGTPITVYGAFFLNKPEYNVKPTCKFGDITVAGTYKSNVRFTCITPEYPVPNCKVPFSISLNGKDFIQSEEFFTFYSVIKDARFGAIKPKSGPATGGSNVRIPSRGLGNEELDMTGSISCSFESTKDPNLKKTVPATIEKNSQEGTKDIVCITPGGWLQATKAKVKVKFGPNDVDTGNEFYFYTVNDLEPTSGPNIGGGFISVEGGGFITENNTELVIDGVTYPPANSSDTKVLFPLPPSKSPNFIGAVSVSLEMQNEEPMNIEDGFYYYEQIKVKSFYPTTGPARGKGKIIVSGDNFRYDFKGAKPTCKIGNFYGKSEIINKEEMVCTFDKIPVLKSKSNKKKDKKEDEGFPFSASLNNYSFVEPENKLKFSGYSVNYISPSSGPISGGTRILVHGEGFTKTDNMRCRFGTPGWFSITQADYIDSSTISCVSPNQFKIPPQGQLPFNVPFSVALTDDEYHPWTETSHTFSFYENPVLINSEPKEGKIGEPQLIKIDTDPKMPFSTPSAIIFEDDSPLYGEDGEVLPNKKFEYQPIRCKFGKFGTTEAKYINRTRIECLTPPIKNDDIGYEKVDIEVAENGQDYVKYKDVTYTFIGEGASKMIWLYILMILFIAILAIILVLLASSFWNKLGSIDDRGSQVRGKRIKYLIDEEVKGDNLNDNFPGGRDF
jgi:hypothetical protein